MLHKNSKNIFGRNWNKILTGDNESQSDATGQPLGGQAISGGNADISCKTCPTNGNAVDQMLSDIFEQVFRQIFSTIIGEINFRSHFSHLFPRTKNVKFRQLPQS
jgi:hypothetical protein